MRNPKPTHTPVDYPLDNTTPAPWGGPATIENRYQWPPLAWLADVAAETDDLYVYERGQGGALTATLLSFEPEMLPTLVVKALRLRALDGHGEVVAVESVEASGAPTWYVDGMALRQNLSAYRRSSDDVDIDLTELFTEQEVAAAHLWSKHNV